MEINISKRKLREYNNRYNFNISNFIKMFNSFYIDDYPMMVRYWKTLNGIISKNVINNYRKLKDDYPKLEETFNKIKKEDDSIDVFELSVYISNVDMILSSIEILPRYLGTSINNVDVFEEPVVDYLIKQGDSLESISKKFYNSYNEFGKIMDYNNIRYFHVNDENWIGKKIKVPIKNKIPVYVEGIIDGHIGENVLGKDIDTQVIINDNDIKTVESNSSFKQGILDILFSPKGSIPEDSSLGHLASNIIGRNIGLLNIPMLTNNLKNVLMLEPGMKTVTISNIEKKEDTIFIDFNFMSILDTEFEYNYKI